MPATAAPRAEISSTHTAAPSRYIGTSIASMAMPSHAASPRPSATTSGRAFTSTTIDSGSASPASTSTRGSARGDGGRRDSHTPEAPSPSIAMEIDRNAKWYQNRTLSNRVTAI
jgi:hypothetical protein